MANPMIPSIGLGDLGGTLLGFILLFIIYLIVIGFVLWLAGEIVVGRRVTFGEALAIAGVGTLLVGASIAPLGVVALLLRRASFPFRVNPYIPIGRLGALRYGLVR